MRMYKWLAVLLLPLLVAGFVTLSGCNDEPDLPPPPEDPPTIPQEAPDDFDDFPDLDL